MMRAAPTEVRAVGYSGMVDIKSGNNASRG